MNKNTLTFQVLAVVLALLIFGCSAYPTQQPTLATTLQPTLQGNVKATLTPAPTPETIQITGNVYVRDEGGGVQGWLENGTSVLAVCLSDNWCYIKEGQFKGLKFYRGCSSDDPQDLACRRKP